MKLSPTDKLALLIKKALKELPANRRVILATASDIPYQDLDPNILTTTIFHHYKASGKLDELQAFLENKQAA